MRYAEGITINEDMLFCKPIKRRATAKEKCVKWSDCVGVCTDAACVMA
jgi:hypothetical protein